MRQKLIVITLILLGIVGVALIVFKGDGKEAHQLGVPFTVIEKDDGTKETILEFDKARIDQALGMV